MATGLYLGDTKIPAVKTGIFSEGGTDTSDATLNSGDQMLNGVTSYSNGRKYTGTIPSMPGETVTTNKTLSTNGKYMTGDIIVNVPSSGITPTGERLIDENGTYDITEYASVKVEVPTEGDSNITVEPLPVTSNGTYTAPSGKAYSPVTVNVPTGTPRSSSDLSVNGATVTAPAGLYSEAASKTIPNGSVTLNTPSVNASGLVTASAALGSAGYISAAPASSTYQLPTQSAKTVTPSESSQTAVAAGVYTTGAVTVSAISSTYVGSGVTRKSAATITPSESQQTISSGQYLTGTQTIAAIPSNYIGSGVQVVHVFSGSGDPSASTGANGDLYLKIGG